jgi:hypothetical protein
MYRHVYHTRFRHNIHDNILRYYLYYNFRKKKSVYYIWLSITHISIIMIMLIYRFAVKSIKIPLVKSLILIVEDLCLTHINLFIKVIFLFNISHLSSSVLSLSVLSLFTLSLITLSELPFIIVLVL